MAPLDFIEHLANVRGWKRVFGAPPHRFQFELRIVNRPESARLPKNLADPFSDGHVLPPRQELDTRHLFVRQNDLKPLTHSLSMTLSAAEAQGPRPAGALPQSEGVILNMRDCPHSG